jgi:ribokinase
MTEIPKFDVIVCGSLHLDIVVKAPALPRIDETAVGSAWQQDCGGKGGNQAMQAAKAGARTAMIGRIGTDDFGERLRANLVNANVDVSALSTDRVAGSGMSVAILQDNGDYGAVIVSGANLTIDPASLKASWDRLGGGKVLVLQNEVPHPVNVAAASLARQSGATVVLNAAPARAIADDLLTLVDVLIVNRVEAEAMAKCEVSDRTTARLALPALGADARSVIITLGGDGMVVSPKGEAAVEILALPVKVTSTHGAGDCFVGVLAAELARGASLVAASHEANKRAALHVSRKT